MGRSGSSKDRRRKTSKETCGRNSSSPMQRSRSLREKLGFNEKETGTHYFWRYRRYIVFSSSEYEGITYKRSKTTDLTPKLERRNLSPGHLPRPRSQVIRISGHSYLPFFIQGDELDLAKEFHHDGERRRKSSFFEQIYNLLKNIL